MQRKPMASRIQQLLPLTLLLAGTAIGIQGFVVAPASARPPTFQLAAPQHGLLKPAVGSSSSSQQGPWLQQQQQQRRGRVVSMVSPAELWQGYLGLIDTHPLITKCATSAVIVPLGDLSAQAIEKFKERKAVLAAGGDPDTEVEGIDWPRVLRFVIFGATLQPIWNHFYFQWFDGLIPPPPTPFDLINVKKVLLDQFIQAPIFTVVIFAFLDVLEGKNWEGIQAQVKRDFWYVITNNWKVWIPFTAINYCFIPSDLRVLFVNTCFLAWCVFLSLVINQKDEPPALEA